MGANGISRRGALKFALTAACGCAGLSSGRAVGQERFRTCSVLPGGIRDLEDISTDALYPVSSLDCGLAGGIHSTCEAIQHLFGVDAKVVWFDESSGLGDLNAYATNDLIDASVAGDGTILLGHRMLESLAFLRREGCVPRNGAAVAALLAHEYAHIFQYANYGIYDSLQRDDGKNILVELYADYLCGYYFAYTKRTIRPDWNINHVGSYYELLGDDYLGTYLDHGTVEERMLSVGAGFQLGTEVVNWPSMLDVGRSAEEYVRWLVRGRR